MPWPAKLLARYVPAAPAEGASAWLRAHRAELYFTDVGGFVWKLRGERADALRPLKVSGLAQGSPVRIQAAANEEELVLELEVRAGCTSTRGPRARSRRSRCVPRPAAATTWATSRCPRTKTAGSRGAARCTCRCGDGPWAEARPSIPCFVFQDLSDLVAA
jgi:hypothetical protein